MMMSDDHRRGLYLWPGVVVVLLALVLAPRAARGDEPAPAPAEPAPPPSATQPAPPPPNLNFNLLADEKPPVQPASPEEAARVARRRAMLTWHQGLGLALFGSLAATVVVGQLNYDDRFYGPSTGRYELAHTWLVVGTTTLFVATGLLGVLAPVPIEKTRQGFDRITLHKIGVFSAAALMAASIGLGIYTAAREGYFNQKDVATAHLVVGWTTFAALALGVGAIVF